MKGREMSSESINSSNSSTTKASEGVLPERWSSCPAQPSPGADTGGNCCHALCIAEMAHTHFYCTIPQLSGSLSMAFFPCQVRIQQLECDTREGKRLDKPVGEAKIFHL